MSNFEVGQIADMVQYVGHGLGVAIVPRAFIPAGSAPTAPVHVLQLVNPALRLAIGAYRRAGLAVPITDAFVELIAHGVNPNTG